MKEIRYSKDAREQLLSGVHMIAKAVKTTLGPSGRNVLIRNHSELRPFSTKDGVTVAGQISSQDPIEQVAIESLQDIANIADEGAGDGTTTATVIAEAIFEAGMNIPEHLNLLDVKRGIDETVKLIVEQLKERAISISEDDDKLRQVALISSNYDEEIASLVFDAFKVAGKQGVVNIGRSRSFESYIKTIEGMNLPTGYRSKFYVNGPEDTCTLEQPWVYSTNKRITKVTPNLEFLLSHVAENDESILIICQEMDPFVSEMLIRNVQQGSIKACVARVPGFGNEGEDLLKDLGTILGKAPFIENEGVAFDDIPQEEILDWIPRTVEAVITEQNLSVKEAFDVNDEQRKAIAQAMKDRGESLREEVRNTKTQYEKSVLQARISRLSNGIAFINIGARSETEYIEKQGRIQDALYAIKSANEEGIVPGGGAALLSLSTLDFGSKSMDESALYGSRIVKEAIRKPFFQIIENVLGAPEKEPTNFFARLWIIILVFFGIQKYRESVLDPEHVHLCESDFDMGFNAKTKDIESDMVEAGIIDPVKVTRVALESAASIAGMLLTTECVVVDTRVYENPRDQF